MGQSSASDEQSSTSAVMSYAVLCCAVLCGVVLCCAVLHYVVLVAQVWATDRGDSGQTQHTLLPPVVKVRYYCFLSDTPNVSVHSMLMINNLLSLISVWPFYLVTQSG